MKCGTNQKLFICNMCFICNKYLALQEYVLTPAVVTHPLTGKRWSTNVFKFGFTSDFTMQIINLYILFYY